MQARKALSGKPRLLFALLAAGNVLGHAGTDLILPAVPILPGVAIGLLIDSFAAQG